MRTRSILAGLLLPAALAGAAPPAKISAVKKVVPPAATPAPEVKVPDGTMGGGAMMGGAEAAAAISPEHKKFFEEKIQPLLEESCYKCHSVAEGKSKGGLMLDTREALRKGGDNGPAVKPGSPEASLMITAVNYTDPDMQMPPKSTGGKLPAEKIALLTEWVKMGAPDPRVSTAKAIASKLTGLTDKARGHWSYLPLKKPDVPRVKNVGWCKTPVDAFILQKLEEKGMVPTAGLLDSSTSNFEAYQGRATLIRRAYYDLIGMPPTPEEIEAFQQDTTPDAFAKVVERLLASPHYGERWARFWLDSARYADTVGGNRNANDKEDYRFAYAWTYRDWVVNALNNDLPYDKFVMNQLAADLIPSNDKKNLAALGFITVGERFGNRNDNINDKIDVVSKGFLGLTVACARCHDHMFDPIPTKDYYALHGIFSSIREPDELPTLTETNPKLLKEFEQKVAQYEAEDRKTYFEILDEGAREFRGKARAYLTAARLSRRGASEKDQQESDRMVKADKLDQQLVDFARGRMREDRIWGPLAVFKALPDGDYDFLGAKRAEQIVKEAGKRYNRYVAEKFRGLKPKRIEDIYEIYYGLYEDSALVAKAESAFAAARSADRTTAIDRDAMELGGGIFRVQPAYELNTENIRDLVQGWPLRMRNKGRYNFAAINELKLTHEGSPVKAMVVADEKNPHDSAVFIRGQATTLGDSVPRSFLEILSPGGQRKPFTKGSGRLELAESIASKDCPLTARVIVNRMWMHHFGEGFVRTPDDLGTQSEKPSHPELIEYLSYWFMNDAKWSIKNLHRLIMLSKAYQISSHTNAAYEQIDPDNRLLWRANVRRLDFEAMRDSMLVMSGKIDKNVGGKPVNLTDEPYSYRRSIYGFVDRGNLPELMAHFDFSDPHMPNSKRTTTIVPQQALFLMNSPFTIDIARAIFARKAVQGAPDNSQRVREIYKILFSRLPRPDEIEIAFKFMRKEKDEEPQMAAAITELTDRAKKKMEEREKRMAQRGMNDQFRAIQNKGTFVERKGLNMWETYVQALLFSNEASYVN